MGPVDHCRWAAIHRAAQRRLRAEALGRWLDGDASVTLVQRGPSASCQEQSTNSPLYPREAGQRPALRLLQKRSAKASVARTSASTVAGSLALWPEVTISSRASGQAPGPTRCAVGR